MSQKLTLLEKVHIKTSHSFVMIAKTPLYKILLLMCLSLLNTLASFAQPTVFESKGMGGGGATFQPSISPFNDGLYYITSDMSHVLKSENAGQTFGQIHSNEFQASGQHSKIQFTADPDILYSFGFTGYPAPNEPMKSMDGGQTWTALTGDPTNGGVWQLFADPTTTQRVVLCSYREVFLSTDGGVSFKSIYAPGSSVYLGGVFWDGTDIYIAVNGATPNGSTPLLLVSNTNGTDFIAQSVNGDFTEGHYFRTMEGVKDAHGQVHLYAVTMHSTFGGLLFSEWWGPTRKLLRLDYSNDATWQSISGAATGLQLTSDGGSFHPNHIVTCASAPNTLYVGGYDAPAMEVYRSNDSGQTWSLVLDCENDNQNQNIATGWIGAGGDFNWWWSGSVLGMEVADSNPDVVIITDFVSAHHTRDGGVSWQALYVSPTDLTPSGSNSSTNKAYRSNGFEVTTCWDMHWFSENELFVGYSDVQGFISDDKGDSWSTDYTYPKKYNTTYGITPAPNGEKIYACVSDKHDMYGNIYLTDALIDSGTGEIFESLDKGKTWTRTYDFQRVVLDLAIDTKNPNRFYACVANSTDGGIYYSKDYGNSWSLLPAPPRTEGHPVEIKVLEENTLVAVFSARYHEGVFTPSSGIFVSADNGQTWQDRSDPRMQYWTMDLEIAADDPNLWFAGVRSHWGANNMHQGGVYKSTNQGLSWERINDFYRVQSISLHPEDSNVGYICTHDYFEGLQYSENLNDPSPDFSPVNAYPFDRPNKVHFNPYDATEVWVTSFGNGLKKGIASLPVRLNHSNFAFNLSENIQLWPNPLPASKNKIYLQCRTNTKMALHVIEIFDITGKKVYSQKSPTPVDAHTWQLDVKKLKTGFYFVKIAQQTAIPFVVE